jgi:RNA binding exosome subunit
LIAVNQTDGDLSGYELDLLFDPRFEKRLGEVNSVTIRALLDRTKDKDKIAEMINNAFGYDRVKEYLSGLNSEDIYYLLENSKDKDGLKRLFDKYGISYEKNESIKILLRGKLSYL